MRIELRNHIPGTCRTRESFDIQLAVVGTKGQRGAGHITLKVEDVRVQIDGQDRPSLRKAFRPTNAIVTFTITPLENGPARFTASVGKTTLEFVSGDGVAQITDPPTEEPPFGVTLIVAEQDEEPPRRRAAPPAPVVAAPVQVQMPPPAEPDLRLPGTDADGIPLPVEDTDPAVQVETETEEDPDFNPRGPPKTVLAIFLLTTVLFTLALLQILGMIDVRRLPTLVTSWGTDEQEQRVPAPPPQADTEPADSVASPVAPPKAVLLPTTAETDATSQITAAAIVAPSPPPPPPPPAPCVPKGNAFSGQKFDQKFGSGGIPNRWYTECTDGRVMLCSTQTRITGKKPGGGYSINLVGCDTLAREASDIAGP